MAEVVVRCELPSEAKFPANTEKYREFAVEAMERPTYATENLVVSKNVARIEQGI